MFKNDIKKIPGKETQYNLFETLSSQETAMEFIPNSMRTFLSCLLVGNEKEKKIAAIGQAIIQATRPRTILAPLQLGLALQVHHLHPSKNLINILSSFGYCVPYNEVILFEKNAAVTNNTDGMFEGLIGESFIQHVADNADHNTCTIDGKNTFHGMGIIVAITPTNPTAAGSFVNNMIISRNKAINAQALKEVGSIPILTFTIDEQVGFFKIFLYPNIFSN